MISDKRQLAEKNMRAAAKAEEIHDALRRGDTGARDLFEKLRATDPQQAQAVADALKGGARS